MAARGPADEEELSDADAPSFASPSLASTDAIAHEKRQRATEEDDGDEVSCTQAVSELFLPVYLPSVIRGMADGVALPAVPLFARALGLGEAQIGTCSAAIPAGESETNCPSPSLSPLSRDC